MDNHDVDRILNGCNYLGLNWYENYEESTARIWFEGIRSDDEEEIIIATLDLNEAIEIAENLLNLQNNHKRLKEILQSFEGTVCDGCGGKKKSRQSHCSKCYFSLPKQMQRDLYKRFKNGYEEAFEASLEFLKKKKAS